MGYLKDNALSIASIIGVLGGLVAVSVQWGKWQRDVHAKVFTLIYYLD
jgi:hypothetical protein